MLNGVGGSTIEEAQRNVTLFEAQRWAVYRRQRGSLNPTRHMERGFAMLAKLYVDAHRRRGAPPVPLHEFMPHEDEPELSLEQAMGSWK